MTAAMVREAARIVDSLELPADAIVSLVELGSEGAVLKVGPTLQRGDRWLIARDGHSAKDEQ